MNYEVTDRAVYTVTRYLIVDDKGCEYYVACNEDDIFDYWTITSIEDGEIDPDSDLGSELIRLCIYHENEKQDQDN